MTRLLLLIDIQRDYFPGGRHPLVEPDAAADAARRLLVGLRTRGVPVIHLQHDAGPGADFFDPATPGFAIDLRVEPGEGEPVLRKTKPNAFLGTGLEQRLRELDVDELVVAGMMTSMCVDATVRAASDLGFAVTVAHDACAAPDLAFGDAVVAGDVVHAAFLAALADGYAEVVAVDDLLAAG